MGAMAAAPPLPAAAAAPEQPRTRTKLPPRPRRRGWDARPASARPKRAGVRTAQPRSSNGAAGRLRAPPSPYLPAEAGGALQPGLVLQQRPQLHRAQRREAARGLGGRQGPGHWPDTPPSAADRGTVSRAAGAPPRPVRLNGAAGIKALPPRTVMGCGHAAPAVCFLRCTALRLAVCLLHLLCASCTPLCASCTRYVHPALNPL